MARFRPLTVDPIRNLIASATETARLYSVLDALSGRGLSRWLSCGSTGAAGYDFSDDPLAAGASAPTIKRFENGQGL